MRTIFLLLLAIPLSLPAQHWAGLWWGHVALRHSNGYERSYGYSFELEQNGKNVTGTSRVWVMGRENMFREMTVTGEVKGGTLSFKEVELLHCSDSLSPDWCRRSGNLNFVRDGARLAASGHCWGAMAPDCPQGTMRLYKVEKYSDTVRIQLRAEDVPTPREPVRKFLKSDTPCEGCYYPPPASVWGRNDSLRGTLFLSPSVKELVFRDYSVIDGDSVLLTVKGQALVPAFGFHNAFDVRVPVNPVELNGSAILMTALSEGREPPCTVTMLWEDEGKKYFLDFEAGLGKGEGFLIRLH